MCHKYDDMPSFFATSAASFSQRSHFIQPTQPLHSANTATSVCQHSHFSQLTQPLQSGNKSASFKLRIRLLKPTKSNLQANTVITWSQRCHILIPAQSYLWTNAAVCIDSMKRMSLRNNMHGFISLLYRANSLKEKLFFFILIPLISHSDLTIWL